MRTCDAFKVSIVEVDFSFFDGVAEVFFIMEVTVKDELRALMGWEACAELLEDAAPVLFRDFRSEIKRALRRNGWRLKGSWLDFAIHYSMEDEPRASAWFNIPIRKPASTRPSRLKKKSVKGAVASVLSRFERRGFSGQR